MQDGRVNGHCDPRFERVREEFERNFAERGEVGASVAITVEGEPVVDLWGGVADPATGRAWEADTVGLLFSSTKGITATCVNVLIDRGLIDVDAPVSKYWPEFAQAGKQDIPVRVLLSHQAGLPAWDEPLPFRGLYDWDRAVEALAAQTPAWEPGTAQGYHAISIGFLGGELVRRVSGRSLGTFLREEVAGPLGADMWIGLPEEVEPRVAPSAMYDHTKDERAHFMRMLAADPGHFRARTFTNEGGWMTTPGELDSREAHAAELPAANGISNARGLARMYAPLALDGSVDGVRLVAAESLPRMRYPRAISAFDLVFGASSSYTLGFSKSWSNQHMEGEGLSVIIGEDAFGTPGAGGSIGFADTDALMSFGYTMNRHGPNIGLNVRGQSLVDAAYRCLGFRTDEPGCWVR